MVETIFSILQLIKDGIQFYKFNNKNLFDNYLEPAVNDFGRVHENYLESFTTYRKMIKETSHPLTKEHPIFEIIQEDALFSINLRDKVYSFYDYSNDSKFYNFSSSLVEYFEYSVEAAKFNNSLDFKHEMYRNNRRRDLFNGLLYVILNNDIDNKKDFAIIQIDKAIKNLQDNYRKVIDNYNSLKNELLK